MFDISNDQEGAELCSSASRVEIVVAPAAGSGYTPHGNGNFRANCTFKAGCEVWITARISESRADLKTL